MLSKDVELSGTLPVKLAKDDLQVLNGKEKLIELTKASIDAEAKIVSSYEEYSTACFLWLPIKTYYLVFHLLCVIECLISGKESALSANHGDCIDKFTGRLEEAKLSFSTDFLNQVFDKSILKFSALRGANLRSDTPDVTIYKLIMKKIVNDKIRGYKKKIIPKAKRIKFEDKIKVSIFNFFYMMRLRMNYDNSSFINNIPAKDTSVYFNKYYISANNFYKALSKYTKELKKQVK